MLFFSLSQTLKHKNHKNQWYHLCFSKIFVEEINKNTHHQIMQVTLGLKLKSEVQNLQLNT